MIPSLCKDTGIDKKMSSNLKNRELLVIFVHIGVCEVCGYFEGKCNAGRVKLF